MKAPAVTGLTLALLWIGAAGLASRLPAPDRLGPEPSQPSTDMVARLFGSGREVISRQLYNEADRYFHKGVGHVHEKAFAHHPYLRWAETITPTSHEELQGDSTAEIMPWLRLATRADPGNVQAYATAAYWLGTQNKLEAAETVLEEARLHNPDDYRVSLALGQFLYHHKKYDRALPELDRAREQWPSGQDTAEKQTQLDLAAILSLGAGIHDIQGNRDQAMARFQDILDLFPDRQAIRTRLAQLEGGETAAEAGHFWENEISSISSASGGAHVEGGHQHGEDCGHDH